MLIDNSKEYILCAAVKRKKPRKHKDGCPYWDDKNDIMNIEIGYRHHDIYQRFNINWKNHLIFKLFPKWTYHIKPLFRLKCWLNEYFHIMSPTEDGFYTSKGRFVDRYEGMEIAYNAGQVSEEVALSKDWYNIKVKINGHTDTPEEHALKDKHKFNLLFSEDLYDWTDDKRRQ